MLRQTFCVAMILIVSHVARADDGALDAQIEQLLAVRGNGQKLAGAVDPLIEMTDRAAVIQALRFHLTNDDPLVRRDVVMALGNLEHPLALQSLRPMLTDPDTKVRHWAGYVIWAGLHGLRTPENEAIFVDAALEEFFHHEFLLNVAGAKPFSIVNAVAPDLVEILDRARASGQITSDDVGWLRTKHVETIAFYSRSAIARLLKDPARMSYLRILEFPAVRTVDDVVAAFDRTWAGDADLRIPNSFHGVTGILFGFPLNEVLRYMGDLNLGRQPTGHNVNVFPTRESASYFGWLVVGGSTESPELRSLLDSGRYAVETYERLAALGLSASQIISRWPACENALGRHPRSVN